MSEIHRLLRALGVDTYADGGRTYLPFGGDFGKYGENNEHDWFDDPLMGTGAAPATGKGPVVSSAGIPLPIMSLLEQPPYGAPADTGGAPPGLGTPAPQAPQNAALASAIGKIAMLGLNLAPTPVSTVGTIGGALNSVVGPGALGKAVSVNGLSTNNAANDAAATTIGSVEAVGPTTFMGMVGNALGFGKSAPSTPAQGLAAGITPISLNTPAQMAPAPDDPSDDVGPVGMDATTAAAVASAVAGIGSGGIGGGVSGPGDADASAPGSVASSSGTSASSNSDSDAGAVGGIGGESGGGPSGPGPGDSDASAPGPTAGESGGPGSDGSDGSAAGAAAGDAAAGGVGVARGGRVRKAQGGLAIMSRSKAFRRKSFMPMGGLGRMRQATEYR